MLRRIYGKIEIWFSGKMQRLDGERSQNQGLDYEQLNAAAAGYQSEEVALYHWTLLIKQSV